MAFFLVGMLFVVMIMFVVVGFGSMVVPLVSVVGLAVAGAQ